MISYSIIQKSQLEGALRLDAEYYQPEYLEVAKILQSTHHKNFDEVVSNIINGAEIREYVEEDGLPYLRVSDIKEFFIDLSSVVYVTKESKIKQNIKLKEDDILLSRSGSLAIAAVVTPDLSDSIISSHLMRISVRGINPYFLVTFLNSKFGKAQIMQRNNGTIVPEINHPSLKSLSVPILSEDTQKEIEKIVRNAYEKVQESNKIYSQAEDLLLEELGIKDFEIDDDLSYIVNLSEIKSAHRADAEYFQPKYDKLVERIKKHGADPLLSLAQNVAARFNPKSQPTKLFQYVELSNITSSVGTIDGFSEVSGDEAPSRAKRVLKTNDVILSSVEGSLEKVALAGKEQEGYLASNGFFQFRSKDILPEVLLVLAKSFILQMQFGKETAGTILTAVPKEAVKNIVVPKVDKSTQQKIADLVQKSHEARKKAKELLEEAKQKVENAIENEINK